ncbi:MAG: pentapeptide repeat-containing protein [Roseibium sp.]
MTIRLSPPKQKQNYLDAGFKGILAILEALGPTGPNIPNILSNLKSGFSALRGEVEDEPGHRAWVWAYKTLSYAVSDVLKTERSKAPLSGQKGDAVKDFLEAATRFEGQELDELAMKNPGLSPLFAEAQKALAPMILKATTGSDLGHDTLNERFRQALRTGSNRTRCEDPAYFQILEDGFTGLAGEGARRDGHWALHEHWISHQFTDAPIFSPDEEEIIPLEAVYLPLRCFWHQTRIVVEENGSEIQQKIAHVSDLHRSARDWLSEDARCHPIRMVTGGPGSGKSSFARAFAHEVIQSGAHRVLFIQLQHMTLSGSLQDDIVRYVDLRDTSTGKHGNPGLPGNPLDWLKTDDKPLLMIFDGLDELSTTEEDGERYARELLLALKLMLSPLNSDGTPIRALVLGRNLACQAAMEISNIPLECMLNVAPIVQMTPENCMMTSLTEENIQDPENLMENDQRADYWQKWAALKHLASNTIPEAVTADSMKELNAEPLLLHLLMISKYSGDDWALAAENKNFVYEDILQKIFERNKHKEHFRTTGVDEQLFFEFMECLGIAAWRGNGRTGDEGEFRQIRKLHLNRERKFKNFPAASLKSVALNIHTRAGQEDSNSGFEFIHKSFGEYLAARGLLYHSIKTAKALDEQEPEDVEKNWCQIIGAAELTTEIIDFLYDEARRKLTPDTAMEPKGNLTELINWALAHGFSIHTICPELSWTDLAIRQRCAISALIASASAIATAVPIGDWRSAEFNAPWTVNIAWKKPGRYSVKELLSSIGVSSETPVINALRRINLSDELLWDVSLSRTNLEGADLRCATITWSLLIGSNLQGANLWKLLGGNAHLKDVSLKGCDLSEALFDEATFEGVDMRYCVLRGTVFANVNAATNNNISFPNRFTGVTIEASIDFEGADLTDADFSNADLSGVVNLSLEAVNSAVGTTDTILPDYINRKEVIWLQDETEIDQRSIVSSYILLDKYHSERLRKKPS